MAHYISPALELILSITCYYYGALFLTRHHFLAAGGYMIIAFTAFIGMMDMAGRATFHDEHSMLTAVSRSIGMLAIGTTIICMLLRNRAQIWGSGSFMVAGVIAAFLLYRHDLAILGWWCNASALVFLLSLIALTVRLALSGRVRGAMAGAAAIVLFILVAAARQLVPEGGLLHTADVVHICLILAYPALYYAMMNISPCLPMAG